MVLRDLSAGTVRVSSDTLGLTIRLSSVTGEAESSVLGFWYCCLILDLVTDPSCWIILIFLEVGVRMGCHQTEIVLVGGEY